MESYPEYILETLKLLPQDPGVYQFLDSKNEIIYIGKAKNLKKRVSSYFQKKNHDSYKSKILVGKIKDIKHIVVDTESDALLLENNLIKKYLPRYNVLLKDDKTFPWICIKNEAFPRVFSTRNVINDGSKYFGPYTSALMVKTLLNLIRQLYQLRTCSHFLSQENVANKKYKLCLEYHIENCKGPCEGLQDEKEYQKSISQIKEILKGNLGEVISFLKQQMKKYSEEFNFEAAEHIKQKIEILNKFQSKSTIVNPSINNVDVFSIVDEDKYAIVNYLKITKGAVVQAHTIELQKKLKESTRELLRFAIIDLQKRVHSNSNNLILPFDLSEELPDYKIIVPLKGDKKKLLDLSKRNALLYKLEKQKRARENIKSKPSDRILEKLKDDLRLKKSPVHIECFDNSNLQGSNPVAACVVFKNGRPAKREYRHYNIKPVCGPDDFASMEEVILRRYKRLIEEKGSIPQLVIVDGGKGQLSAALKSLDVLKLRNKVAIIGIAKRLEEIYFPDDPVPLYIDKNSESLRLIQFLRNEAHRFGIEFHRLKRSNSMINSELSNIEGIGQLSVNKLFKHLKSIENIQNSTEEEISKILDKRKAKKIVTYFSKQ